MSILFREGVMLAVAPVIAFGVALMFETGYADAFGISHELIDVDLRGMIISAIVVLFAFIPFISCTYFLFHLGTRRERIIRWWAIQLMMVLPMLISIYVSGFTSYLAYAGLGLALAFGSIAVMNVAWRARKIGWKEAFEKAADSEGIKEFSGQRPASKPPRIWDKLLACIIVLFLFTVLALMIQGVGKGVAKFKSAYPTFTMDGKPYAILSGYGDRFVLGGIEDNSFDGNISVVPKNSEKLTNISVKRYDNFLLQQ